jgi:hypothetical protein
MSDANPFEEYYVKQLTTNSWQVTKFTNGDRPEAIYTVTFEPELTAYRSTHFVCNCQGNRNWGWCRHVGMVKDTLETPNA